MLTDEQTITINDLPREISDRPPDAPYPFPRNMQRLHEIQKAHIVEILERENGNKERTLGIRGRKVHRLLERFDLHQAELMDD